MSLLDRYVARTLLGTVALVLAVLLVLGLIFIFIGEQGDVGVGRYGMVDAVEYSLLSLPQFALESFPAAALIGGLLGIGILARSNELTVMRASGMSTLRLSVAVLTSAALLIVVQLLIGEALAQPLSQLADERKAFAKYANISFAGAGGAWIRDGNTILSVENRASRLDFGGMLIIELTADNRIGSIGRAERATPAGAKLWRLHHFSSSTFRDDSVTSDSAMQRMLNTTAGAGLMQLAAADPQELSLHTLDRAIRYLHREGLDATRYVFAFWARIARTSGILAAMLFALPFGFGSMRSASLGSRMTLGFAIGILYFFMQRLAESGTEVFRLQPLLLAWLPTAMLALADVVLIWRAR